MIICYVTLNIICRWSGSSTSSRCSSSRTTDRCTTTASSASPSPRWPDREWERERGGQRQKILTYNYWAKYSTTISISYVFISTSLILIDWLYSSALLYYKWGNFCFQVYPDDFGEFRVRVSSNSGMTETSAWVGEMPVGEEYLAEQEPDLPAWCNKVRSTWENRSLTYTSLVKQGE